jgi:uncharacterized protein (DUF2384 family)
VSHKKSPPKATSAAKSTRPTGASKNGVATPIPKPIEDLALLVIGTKPGADFWIDRPNPELGGQSPRQLIAAGCAEVVKDFLESLEAGDFG